MNFWSFADKHPIEVVMMVMLVSIAVSVSIGEIAEAFSPYIERFDIPSELAAT